MQITASLPDGYLESADRGMRVVAQREHHDAVRAAVAHETLHAWAARQPAARPLQGRGVAWATRLASGREVVVRHSRHGGLLAPLTRDLFLAPTRAPRELEVSLRLRDAGVPTPAVVAFVTYSAFGPFCRADVATSLVAGADLPAFWGAAADQAARNAITDAVAVLLRALRDAGAHHPDLNAKNVFLSSEDGIPRAWVLDVDRMTFGRARDDRIAVKNARRLLESFAKWRSLHRLDIADADMARLAEVAGLEHNALQAAGLDHGTRRASSE